MGSPEALEKSLGTCVITARHEMFDVFQAANNAYDKAAEVAIGPKGDSSCRLTFPYPYRDVDAMRLIHLQGYLVWLAANSSAQEDAKYNIGTQLMPHAFIARTSPSSDGMLRPMGTRSIRNGTKA